MRPGAENRQIYSEAQDASDSSRVSEALDATVNAGTHQ